MVPFACVMALLQWKRGHRCIATLIWAVACSTSSAEALGTGLQQILASRSDSLLIETDGADIREVVRSDSLIHFLLSTADSSIVLTCDYNARVRHRFGLAASDGHLITGLNATRDGSEILMYDIGSEHSEGWGEGWVIRVYSVDGKLRLRSNADTGYRPSPRGKFFCNSSNTISGDPFVILAVDGREVIRTRRFSEWSADFIDDDTVLLVTRDSLYFFDSHSGQPIAWLRHRLDNATEVPRLSIEGARFALFNHNSLILYSTEGHELWQRSFTDWLAGVCIDTAKSRVVLQFQVAGSRAGYLKVLSLDTDEATEAKFEHELFATITSSCSGPVFLQDDLFIAWSPRWMSSIADLMESNAQTLFLNVDSLRDSMPDALVLDGLYIPLESFLGCRRFLYLHKGLKPVILNVDCP